LQLEKKTKNVSTWNYWKKGIKAMLKREIERSKLMKRIYPLILIFILFPGFCCSSFFSMSSSVNHTFENFLWGCSKEYVKKHEHGYQFKSDDNDSDLFYYWFRREFSRGYPFTYMRFYSFEDNKLVRTHFFTSEPDYYYDNDSWMGFNNVKHDIDKIYGEPEYVNWIWIDAEYIDKEKMFYYDTYIRMGHLKREALWVTPSTVIVEQMSGSKVDGDIAIFAYFYEKNYYIEHYSGQLWSDYEISEFF